MPVFVFAITQTRTSALCFYQIRSGFSGGVRASCETTLDRQNSVFELVFRVSHGVIQLVRFEGGQTLISMVPT